MINDLRDPFWKKLRKYIDLSCCHWMLAIDCASELWHCLIFTVSDCLYIKDIFVVCNWRISLQYKKVNTAIFHYRQPACISIYIIVTQLTSKELKWAKMFSLSFIYMLLFMRSTCKTWNDYMCFCTFSPIKENWFENIKYEMWVAKIVYLCALSQDFN